MTTARCPPHRWRLDPPHGTPTVRGRCRCGAERQFAVAMPSYKSWTKMMHEGAHRDAATAEAEWVRLNALQGRAVPPDEAEATGGDR